MSRVKGRTATEVCADCSAPDPTWASINRGVLICDECCSVHRSLGRHISQIKSLNKGQWSPTLLSMVQHLANHGANSIWEHSLLDPSQSKHGKKKPGPRDQVHPVKAEFIRSKYQFLQFINKQKDGDVNSIDDLSKQLHSSVRTSNLETCLRLLSKGADPNYFHPEKGNCPLHVAAQSGQPLQVELLVIYGADPGAFDSNGKTPIDHAKAELYIDLADRILELHYELTDRLAYYVCKRKPGTYFPDHKNGIHFIIPEMADSSLDLSELAKQAKLKLQALPNHLFEELAMDVYDEVDRRENDEHWSQSHDNSAVVSDRQGVPFLPLNPDFSATRNQGRQKLARFNAREFTTLVIDILSDAKRRQTGAMSPTQTPKEQEKPTSPMPLRRKINSIASDEEPLYDVVASDEDYSSIDNLSISSSKLKHQPHHEVVEGPVSTEEFLQMKRKLGSMECQVHQLLQQNKDLRKERDDLHLLVQKLTKEITILREHTQQHIQTLPNGYGQSDDVQNSPIRNPTRPQSMFEPRDQQRLSQKSQSKDSLPSAHSFSNLHMQEEGCERERVPSLHDEASAELQKPVGQDVSHYDCPTSLPLDNSAINQSFSEHFMDDEELNSCHGNIHEIDPDLPSQEVIMEKTEKITKNIQELYQSGQTGKHDSFGPCADKIHNAVTEMASLFPIKPKSESVKCALHLLVKSAGRLQQECYETGEGEPYRTQQVMQGAFDIAKAVKQLVTLFQ
ncbi:ARF GTPase-activating protein GIT2-like isoform X1 [Mytilus trossulus]|uniref:ARF GTPase-activating protein GIT2-like isoform X1 n=1 Tax=Mytilus trossulus TaxID=6551 RepID=UPI00300698FC